MDTGKRYFITKEKRDAFNMQEAVERRYFKEGAKWYDEGEDDKGLFLLITSKSWQDGPSNRIYFNSEQERAIFNAALAVENNADPEEEYYPYGEDDISWYIKTPDGTLFEKLRDWIYGN